MSTTAQDTVKMESADDIALADKMNAARGQIIAELKKLIIGQDETVNLILLSLFVGGNSLIVGVPGLAKTLLIRTLAQVLDLIQPALSRAIDFGVIHGINPTGGAVVAAMTQRLTNTTNLVEYVAADKPYVSLDAADALILADGFVPRDIALAPTYASKFSALRGTNSEQKLYPNFQTSTDVSELDGHRASVSRTVSGAGVIAVDTKVLGIVGDFDALRWGVQKSIGLEVIRYGDPDGGGDLKRNNQVAFRAEVVYGWGIADLNAFAKIHDLV